MILGYMYTMWNDCIDLTCIKLTWPLPRFFVVRIFKIYALASFYIHNVVLLTVVTMMTTIS